MNEQAQAFWDQYEENAKQEMSTGRGGAIAFVEVQTGWKAFASGVSNDESWFPALRSDKTEWNAAKKAAQALCDEGRFASSGVTIIAAKDKYFMYGEKREYEENRHFWRSEYHELTTHKDSDGNPKGHAVLFPALRAAGVVAGFKGWVRLVRVPNPYYKDDEDKAWDKAITIITEVFANPAAAKKAIAEMPKKEAGESNVPEGYNADDWAEMEEQYLEAVKEALDSRKHEEDEEKAAEAEKKMVASLADDWGVATDYVRATLNNIVPV